MKILGTTEEFTTCDCCGKQNLKKTVVIESEETGIAFYGVVCAAHVMKSTKKAVEHQIKEIETETVLKTRAEAEKKSNAWIEFLKVKTGEETISGGFTKLGGFSIARRMFEEQYG